MRKNRTATPQITSIENALKVYYNHSEIGNKEITALFGKRSSATISRLKRMVKDEMHEQGVFSYRANTVNTAVAFTVWGLDIADLEQRMKKLKELNFAG